MIVSSYSNGQGGMQTAHEEVRTEISHGRSGTVLRTTTLHQTCCIVLVMSVYMSYTISFFTSKKLPPQV